MMGYVPQDAKWYIAELIEEIRVEGSEVNILHKNLVLVRADSPDEAYGNALKLGQSHNNSYVNPSGAVVKSSFRGLHHLDVIHDDLENGAELLYEQETSVSEEYIQGLLRTREDILLFREPTIDTNAPDYASGEIVQEALPMIEAKN